MFRGYRFRGGPFFGGFAFVFGHGVVEHGDFAGGQFPRGGRAVFVGFVLIAHTHQGRIHQRMSRNPVHGDLGHRHLPGFGHFVEDF